MTSTGRSGDQYWFILLPPTALEYSLIQRRIKKKRGAAPAKGAAPRDALECRYRLLLHVGQLETIVLLAVNSLEEEAHQQGDDTEAGEDKHGKRIVLRLTFGHTFID